MTILITIAFLAASAMAIIHAQRSRHERHKQRILAQLHEELRYAEGMKKATEALKKAGVKLKQ